MAGLTDIQKRSRDRDRKKDKELSAKKLKKKQERDKAQADIKRKFFISGKEGGTEVSEEEFKRIKGQTGKTGGFAPQTQAGTEFVERGKLGISTEEQEELRRVEAIPQVVGGDEIKTEAAVEEVEVPPQQVIEGEVSLPPEQELDAEGNPILGGEGTASPVTPGDLTDLLTAFTGVGLGKAALKKIASKAGGKQLLGEVAEVEGKQILKTDIKATGGKLWNAAKNQLGKVVGGIAAIFAVGKFITKGDTAIAKIDTALSQIRETITAPVQMVANGARSPSEGLQMIDEMNQQVLQWEREVHDQWLAPGAAINPETLYGVEARIKKLKWFLESAERDIRVAATQPTEKSRVELAVALQSYEQQLKGYDAEFEL